MYFLLEKNKKGGFFTMIKNRRTSGLLSMALATCLVVSAVPVQTVDSILGNAARHYSQPQRKEITDTF